MQDLESNVLTADDPGQQSAGDDTRSGRASR